MTHPNKGKRFPSEPLARHEVDALLAACQASASERYNAEFYARRTAALIALMWRTGMRHGEALSLRPHDLNLLQSTVRVMQPKGVARGVKPRVLGIDAVLRPYLERWLEARADYFTDELGTLFVTSTGGRVLTMRLRDQLPRLACKAGMRGRRVSPHMFRHTFAFDCAMEGRPIPWISACLGHKSIRTTEVYIHHLAPADVISGMKERA